MSESGLKDLAREHKFAQDHKREIDNRRKWHLGEATSTRGNVNRRPAKPTARSPSSMVRRAIESQQNKAAHIAKISRKHQAHFDTSDSSAEEDVKEASAAPEPDAEYTYSYDAPRGPGKGSQILGMALAKAVEKYEYNATEKLIEEEYDVVGKGDEESHAGYAADEDDFELV